VCVCVCVCVFLHCFFIRKSSVGTPKLVPIQYPMTVRNLEVDRMVSWQTYEVDTINHIHMTDLVIQMLRRQKEIVVIFVASLRINVTCTVSLSQSYANSLPFSTVAQTKCTELSFSCKCFITSADTL